MAGKSRISILKWVVASAIALVGAGGGLVAILQYQDARRQATEARYQQALATWSAFTPASLSHGAHDIDILGGHYVDLDLGRVAMSLTGPAWDVQFVIGSSGGGPAANEVGLRLNEGVEVADLGVADFSQVGYRDIRDAEFRAGRQIGGRGRFAYFSHITAAPDGGYLFAIKTSAGNVAKFQVKDYTHQSVLGVRSVRVRYEVFPSVPDPPRPRRQ